MLFFIVVYIFILTPLSPGGGDSWRVGEGIDSGKYGGKRERRKGWFNIPQTITLIVLLKKMCINQLRN